MDPVTTSALISAGAGLIGNIFGSKSNSSTNKTNLKIAQMNNEFNERMMQKQMDYNTEMWNKQNQYNTPSAQAQRLRDAGLNPALMMGQGQTGIAQSANSVSPASAQGATMNAYNPDMSMIGAAASQYIEHKFMKRKLDSEVGLTDAQRDAMYIENQFRAAKALGDLYEQQSRIRGNDEKTKYQSIINKYADQMQQSQLATELSRRNNMNADTENRLREGIMMDYRIQKLPQKLALELANMSADVLLKRKQGVISQHEAEIKVQELYDKANKAAGLYPKDDDSKGFVSDMIKLIGTLFAR